MTGLSRSFGADKYSRASVKRNTKAWKKVSGKMFGQGQRGGSFKSFFKGVGKFVKDHHIISGLLDVAAIVQPELAPGLLAASTAAGMAGLGRRRRTRRVRRCL